MTGHAVTWSAREPPLTVCGILASGDAALALAERLLVCDPALDVFLGEGTAVALAESAALPWVDGVTWLGRDGPLLCPTTLRPSVPPALVVDAVRRSAGVDGLAVVTPDYSVVLRSPEGQLDRTSLVHFARSGVAP